MLATPQPPSGRRQSSFIVALCAILAATLGGSASVVRAQAPATAAAPPVNLTEEIVVTASVEPVAFASLTRAVQVAFAREFERLGVTSAADALRLVAGVDVRARGPRDVQTDFSIRGATFGQTLVLVDGWRLNDSQSGHHNGDMPAPVSGIDRIEVVSGAGSSIHGADALGGTINVITRRAPHATVAAAAGQHGYASAEGSLSGRGLPEGWTVTGWGSRSNGFMFDRDFALGGALARGQVRDGLVVDVRHLRKAFGANGFYGASPSKEWTDLSLAGVSWQGGTGGWTTTTRGVFRNHGDHFRWDIARPGFAENRHRTNAASGSFHLSRSLAGGRHLTFGGAGGADVIRSSNLGDRRYGHGAAYAEFRSPLGARAAVQTGLRLDGYSTFGASWSPSISAGAWVTPTVRLRASGARAFRIPTFTERFYTDPAHLASDALDPERGWSIDAGVDWADRGWLAAVSGFRRWDEDVIDWVKARPEDRWRTTNVRDVTSTGLEASIGRAWPDRFVRVTVSALDVEAPSLTLLSKYVLEYTRAAAGVAASSPVAGWFRLAANVDHRRRHRADAYTVVNLRISRDVGRTTIFVDAANAFAETYVEIPGVAMPGRWVTVGLRLR